MDMAYHLFGPYELLIQNLNVHPERVAGLQYIRASTFFENLKYQKHSWFYEFGMLLGLHVFLIQNFKFQLGRVSSFQDIRV